MNNLQTIFSNKEFGKIRAIKREDGAIYFVAKDIAKCLGYGKLDSMYRRLSDKQKLKLNPQTIAIAGFPHIDVTEFEPNVNVKTMVLVTEGGLYKAVLGSQLPQAEKFQEWVTDEVLPSIRKHGAYITETTLNEMIQNPDTMIKVLQNLKEEQEKNKKLESEALEMLPKVEQYDSLMNSHDLLSMNETAKSIGVGRNDLFNLLRNKGILMSDKKNKKDHNVPYQRYIDSKYFTVVEHEIMGETQPQTFVSTKGLDWLSKKLSNEWKDELKNIKKEIIENNKNNKAS